jgi:hypothetical protein
MGSSTQAQKLTSSLNQVIKKLERITYEYKRSTSNNTHIVEAWQDARVRVQHTSTRMQDWHKVTSCEAGSVCANCYAYERGRYRFQNVKDAQYKRFAALKHPLWAPAMALQINSKKVKYFRWHDSGDVQNLDHLNKIYEVCRLSPDVKHWMPTREAWVKDHLASCPDNLIIRLSAPMVDQAAPDSWPHTSTVVTSGRTCPAPDQGNQCKDCRACWDKEVKNIAYGEH